MTETTWRWAGLVETDHQLPRAMKFSDRAGKHMGLAGHTTTHEFEILSAGEVFDRVDAAYIVGLEARGLSPCARRYMQTGKVKVTEWTNYCISARLRAAAMGVPFVPTRNLLGTDTFEYSGSKIIECPYTGKKLALQPALYPDVAIIHVHESDVYGNCRIRGILKSDNDLARAAKRTIITCERLISNEEIRRDPVRDHHSLLPGRRRVRSALWELSGQHGLRILLR